MTPLRLLRSVGRRESSPIGRRALGRRLMDCGEFSENDAEHID